MPGNASAQSMHVPATPTTARLPDHALQQSMRRTDTKAAPRLNRLLVWYVWSVVVALAIVVLCVGVAVVTPFGASLRWAVEVSGTWVLLPVRLAAWVADAIAAPEDPWGPQTPAWRHVFWLTELPWIAISSYECFRLFRSGMTVSALLASNLLGLYLIVGTFECYAALT
jgi:hypothetical protein